MLQASVKHNQLNGEQTKETDFYFACKCAKWKGLTMAQKILFIFLYNGCYVQQQQLMYTNVALLKNYPPPFTHTQTHTYSQIHPGICHHKYVHVDAQINK